MILPDLNLAVLSARANSKLCSPAQLNVMWVTSFRPLAGIREGVLERALGVQSCRGGAGWTCSCPERQLAGGCEHLITRGDDAPATP